MEFEKILQLIESVSKSELTGFTLEEGDMKITLEANRGTGAAVPVAVNAAVDGSLAAVAAVAASVSPAENVQAAEIAGNVVKSPLVGTFYSAPSPEADNFVKVGDTVCKGQTLGIVEAMKLMNEIECEFDGVVKEILIENEAIVEFGQPLFVIG